MTALPIVSVDVASPVPPYEQIRAQLTDLIRHAMLTEGERLPPVRQLAGDLNLAVGTVARAYRELEAGGLVVSRRGAGTRVARAATLTPDQRAGALAEQARAYVSAARRLGASDDDLTAAVRIAVTSSDPPRTPAVGAPERR